MLDVTVFRNPRFSAASLSITFVFFALMGVMFFLTTYMQSVRGYSAFDTGVRVLPVAFGMVLATRLSVKLVARSGRRWSWRSASPPSRSRSRCTPASASTPPTRTSPTALFLMGAGMGLAMSPATEAIMGSLPKSKAGVGSAMNDVVREIGGTLGVAILGSVLNSSFASAMTGDQADSVGGAHAVAAQLESGAAPALIDASNHAFVDAMATTAGIAAAVALLGALIAAALLPARAVAPAASGRLEPATA